VADLVLYTNPMSRGRIARWMLEEVGAPYETVLLAYGPEMRSPDHLALNPMGKVPTLVHGGRVVTECGAICAHLADAFPDAGLAPPPAERAAYYRWLFFGAGPVEAATINQALGFTTDDPKQQGMLGYGALERVVEALVAAVSSGPYIAGDAFTAADVYLGAQLGWTLEFGTMPRHQALVDYAERVRDRDAYRRAKALDDAAMPATSA
jgi:glutathione S-transferase